MSVCACMISVMLSCLMLLCAEEADEFMSVREAVSLR